LPIMLAKLSWSSICKKN